MFLSDAELKGDKFIFNRITKEFVAEGNVSLEKVSNILKPQNFFYNLKDGKGYIKEVYGVLDVDNFSKISNLI